MLSFRSSNYVIFKSVEKRGGAWWDCKIKIKSLRWNRRNRNNNWGWGERLGNNKKKTNKKREQENTRTTHEMYTKENSTDEGKKERKGQGRTGCEIEWGREKSGNKLTSRKNISFFIFFYVSRPTFQPCMSSIESSWNLTWGVRWTPLGSRPTH